MQLRGEVPSDPGGRGGAAAAQRLQRRHRAHPQVRQRLGGRRAPRRRGCHRVEAAPQHHRREGGRVEDVLEADEHISGSVSCDSLVYVMD